MASGPVVAMVWEGLTVVKTGRVMLGETNPKDSKPGTIRGDFCIQVSGKNVIYGLLCSNFILIIFYYFVLAHLYQLVNDHLSFISTVIKF